MTVPKRSARTADPVGSSVMNGTFRVPFPFFFAVLDELFRK